MPALVFGWMTRDVSLASGMHLRAYGLHYQKGGSGVFTAMRLRGPNFVGPLWAGEGTRGRGLKETVL